MMLACPSFLLPVRLITEAGQGLLINLEGANIGFDALETGNIVTVWWMQLFTQSGVST